MNESGSPVDRLARRLTGARLDTSAAVAVTDRDGRVTYWSIGAEKLLGYTATEIIGRSVADLLAADGTMLHRDGRPLDVQVNLCPLLDAGPETGLLLTAQRPAKSEDEPGVDALAKWAFDQNPTPLALYDREARLQRLNRAMARAIDYHEDEIRGKFLTDFLRGAAYEDIERRIFLVLENGKPQVTEPFVRTPGEPRAHAWTMDVFPLKDAAGRVQGVGVTASDYSRQYDSRERFGLLSEARTRIGASLDVAGTARELAQVAVPRFADLVTVDLLDAVFQGDLPGPVPSGPVLLRSATSQATSPIPWGQPMPGDIRRHPASSPIAQCLITGRAELQYLTAPEIVHGFGEDSLQATQVGQYGTHSLIAVPIRAHGTILGVALFVRFAASREPFRPDDLAVTEDLVARVAVCLDNARRFTRERGIALALQRSLLPWGPAVHPAVETAARYLPAGGGAEVCGDWFDVIPLPGARVGLVVGDVVGHGINAAATMGRLRTAVRTLADIDLPPDELLTHLDDIVTHAASEQNTDAAGDVPGDIGASCLYAVYDPLSGTCSLARAGHPAPVLVHPDGTSTVIDLPAGPPLGLGSLPFEATEVTVPEGSLLALFTDGLLVSGDGDVDEGLGAVRRALAQPASSLEELCDAVLDTVTPGPHADDIALLLTRTRSFGEDRVASWDVPADGALVAETRRHARDQLAAWGLEEAEFVTELVVSELTTNAIRYARGPIRLRLIKDKALICEVSDCSSTSPHLRRARAFDEGGRGLFLVAELTQRWGTRYTRAGKTIWAELAITTPSGHAASEW